jgi:hypothetical protein
MVIYGEPTLKGLGSGSGTASYDGGVKVVYGVTTVVCDKLTVNLATMHAVATGHVHVTDPDVNLDAQELEFTWAPGKESGHLDSFNGTFDGLHIRSSAANITHSKIELGDVDFRPDSGIPNLYRLRSPRITIVAGRYIRIEHPHLKVFGLDIPWHKTIYHSLDRRVDGPGLPTISLKDGSPGISYYPSFLVGSTSVFQVWGNIFRGSLPLYGAQISHTFLNPNVPDQGHIVPGSDLDSRFGYGFFDNVTVPSPEYEFSRERLHRSSISFDSQANEGSGDRLPGGSVTKLGEATYENGGPLGPLGQITDVRLQSVTQQGDGRYVNRLEAETSVGVPPLHLSRDIQSVIRFDAEGFAGDQAYGWARAQFGLAFRPFNPITLSAAYVTATQSGTPDLTTDELYNYGAWCYRADAYLGSIRASYLERRYLSGRFFDDEYQVSHVVGSFDLFVIYRRFPSAFRVGFTLRTDDILASFQKHHPEAQSSDKPVPLLPASK